MRWNPNEPITQGYYLCAAVGYNRPIMLCWYLDKKQWGEWIHGAVSYTHLTLPTNREV